MNVDDAIANVLAAERGPHVVACFDYDGTVITGFSAEVFYRHRIRNLDLGPIELVRTLLHSIRGIETEEDFRAFLELSLDTWSGKPEAEIAALGEKLFKHEIGSKVHLEIYDIVQAHHEMGHTVVLASSATRYQIEPIARELGADHILCTSLEVRDGILTGKPEGRPLWGPAKGDALAALAAEHDYDLAASFAYSNGTEDVPLLLEVGHPVCVEPEDGLREVAEEAGWPILRPKPRGGRPGLFDVARTTAFYGGLAAGFGIGAGIGILHRSRTEVLDLGGGIGADIGLALAGVEVDVQQGREHLWSSRPCVFVFNHQSKLDPIVLMKLLRERFTGVGKKEVKKVPFFGQVFMLAGVAFIDRTNITQARKAMEPAVRKIRDEQMSLVISPEGTRSVTPRLGRFKKGPFHIAMQAEVPMVPIVMRNVGEVMWRGAQTIKPGRVEVVVLPPVDTSEWKVETIDEHVAHVRDQFVDTLAHWPGSAIAALPQGVEA